jgi:hypothetical protein
MVVFFLPFTGHDKERLHFEAFIVGAQSITIVEFIYVYNLFHAGDDVDGHVIVTPVLQYDHASMKVVED